MKRRLWLIGALVALSWATPARADTGVIIRTTGGLPALQALCFLPATCTVVGGLDGALGQVFLVTTPLPLQNFLGLLPGLTGFVDAEVNQLLNLVGGLNLVPTAISPTLMQDRSSVPYPANSTTQTAWNSYVNQPAASIVGVQNAQKAFNVTGNGIVADIDTGVDPNHPVLQPVLVPGNGYDFTRNQAGGSELNDLPPSFPTPTPCSSSTCPSPAQVNQSSVAVLDQSSVAVLDGNSQYAAFGHGTMVMGIIHLVAPTAQLMPLKAFHSDGTAALSDILRAIYYGVQNSANVINMSFDTKTSSVELQKALDYANQQGVLCAASAGNDGTQEIVYPAALQNDVMGVASTSDQDSRSSFSNYGSAIVWVAAPGEAIVSTYPFNTYAAGWGTSFSAPFVSGGAALLNNLQAAIKESGAAAATANAVPLDPSLGLNHGRLDLVMTLGSLGGTPDYGISASPTAGTINAGQSANFTVSAAPAHGFDQTVTWTCSVAPAGPTCAVSPSSVKLDGSSTATATATMMTTMRGGLLAPQTLRRYAPPQPRMLLVIGFAWIAVVLVVWGLAHSFQRRPGLAAAAGIVGIALCTYSCGGYGGGPPGSGSPTLSSVTLNPAAVTGGSSSTGTVTLSGPPSGYGASVNLTSSASAATVPASVTVASGATSATFTVNTTAVTASTMATITASYGDATKTASLTVTPSQAASTLSSLTLNPTSVTGGAQSSTGTVMLTGPAPTGGAQIMLSSDNGTASVPASVTVAAGASSATFTVSTSAAAVSTPVTISASYAGVTKTASLTVAPAGTPAGTYTLTITGTSGNLSHSTAVQVTVN
ncbi:MAG TPA: S8 family serine peptidase [Candidatus Acidoferrum sp.]|nr:S8 family serine peptidase [Candidatus Acidoferrum sp.]